MSLQRCPFYLPPALEYRIRMIILMVRMMAIGAIILDRTLPKESATGDFSLPARTAKNISGGGKP